MDKLLLTGASGQIGRALKPELDKLFKICAPSKSDLDMSDLASIHTYLYSNSFDDTINGSINCAAFNDVDACEDINIWPKALAINTTNPMYIANWMFDKTFLTFSSDYVFNGNTYIPYKETDLPTSLSTYGEMRAQTDIFLTSCHISAIVVRTSNVFSYSGSKKPLIQTVIDNNLAKIKMNLVCDNEFSPSYAPDMVAPIISLYRSKSRGLWNLTNSGSTSSYDFARYIVDKIGGDKNLITPIKHADFKTVAPRPKYSVLDNTKIQIFMGSVMPTWQDGVDRYLIAKGY